MIRVKKTLFPLLMVFLVFCSPSCLRGEETPGQERAREPAVAGGFYPADPKELRSMIETFLKEAPDTNVPGYPIALISPHAGYVYSGKTAAAGFKTLAGLAYDTVIVIGPSHHYAFEGAAIYADGPYRTPLGDAPLDAELTRAIVENGERITTDSIYHEMEHSVEVEIPFLQVVLGDFKVVPIVMGSHSRAVCEDLAGAIARSVGTKKVLIVASSDLSHYHPRELARRLDGVFEGFLEKNDPDGLYESMVTGRSEACGGGPVVTALLAAEALGSTGVIVTKYDDSGTANGDTSKVVGYVSAIVYGRGSPPAGEGGDPGTGLTPADKKKLLSIARRSIEWGLTGGDSPDFGVKSAMLKKNGAAFVTLWKHGELRGCIGSTEPDHPLWETVEIVACGAAFHDPRFFPVTKEELKDIAIEVSVLSELAPVKSIDEIVIGTHGLVIRKGGSQGLFLPEVPVEQGWNRDEYIENVCEKAGLPPSDWKEKDAELYIFTTDHFSEE